MGQKIHLIFKTHLDIGFTDLASSVIQKYFTEYIPSALHVAREMQKTDQSEKFIWTTGSWLIYEYLEKASPTQRKEMETAILAGNITWHALPFTTHTELMDMELFRFGLSISQELDQRFGKHTIAAKMTDVPGHTRGIIPLMVDADIQFLHIGVNPGSPIPCVPALFRWQDPSGKELIVMYESGYGNIFTVDGIEDALAFAHTIDNLGPQSTKQVFEVFHAIQTSYPDAQIFASTLNDFASKLEPIRNHLPIITQEIGDTWIHGIGSDPLKVSQFRELLRMRSTWLINDPTIYDEKWFKSFQRRLLLVPEHTWGMDEKTFLRDHDNYEVHKFNAARNKANFKQFESSWAEKRTYIQSAVEELGNSPFANSARKHLESIRPSLPDLSNWIAFSDVDQAIELTYFTIRFNPLNGSLASLVSQNTMKEWSGEYHPIGFLRYQTFSSKDYERFFHQYILPAEQKNSWSREDFTKPGMEQTDPPSRFWHPSVLDQYQKSSNEETKFLFRLAAEPQSSQKYGCPQDFYLQYTFHNNAPVLDITLQWFNKPACRQPEALWFSFKPQLSQNAEWSIEKLGENISPLDIVENGNRHLHASGKNASFIDMGEQIEIMSLDSPLVAPGQPALLNFTNDQPDITGGMHFNLMNNVWGTNFPMWFEDDCRFRFIIRFSTIGI